MSKPKMLVGFYIVRDGDCAKSRRGGWRVMLCTSHGGGFVVSKRYDLKPQAENEMRRLAKQFRSLDLTSTHSPLVAIVKAMNLRTAGLGLTINPHENHHRNKTAFGANVPTKSTERAAK